MECMIKSTVLARKKGRNHAAEQLPDTFATTLCFICRLPSRVNCLRRSAIDGVARHSGGATGRCAEDSYISLVELMYIPCRLKARSPEITLSDQRPWL
jgi:hypothetical protein